MKRSAKLLSILLILALVLSGCGQNASESDSGSSNTTAESSAGSVESTEISLAESDSEMFTDRDFRTEYEDTVVNITLNGDSVSCDSDAVTISGTTVQLTQEATYVITGTLDDGMILVNAADTAKLQIVLNGASVTSASSAALYILEADKVFVTLAEGTENALANGGEFVAIDENNIDGAVFSKQDLTFNGSGTLAVTSPAGHGIVCKDDLVFTGGSYTVNAASHSLDANDSVRVIDASITADAGKDGIHSENSDDTTLGFVYISSGSFTIEAEGDGVSAAAYLQILDGTFAITAGGGSENGSQASSGSYGGFMGGNRPGGNQSSETDTTDESTSMKGMKAAGNIQITGGSFLIDSADDAVHADASATVTAGEFQVASGDDAFHAEETLEVSGGTIDISESYEGLEALDITISGGEITLVASDDGLNAAGGTDSSGTTGGRDAMFGGGMGGGMSSGNGSIVITGGTLDITASGDGIDANGTLEITGGYTTVCGPTQGDTATLDYDKTAVISGGTFIGTGASGMAQTFSSSENQGLISVSVGSQSAGTTIEVTDSGGNTVLTHTPDLSFGVVILSSPDIVKGQTYTITVGSQSGSFEAD